MFANRWIMRQLRQFGKDLAKIDAEDENLEDIRRWYRNVRPFLAQLFGGESDICRAAEEVLKLNNHSFSTAPFPSDLLSEPNEDFIKAMDPTHPYDRSNYKDKYRDEFRAILAEAENTIRAGGVPSTYRLPPVVMTGIGICVTIMLGLLALGTNFVYRQCDSAAVNERNISTRLEKAVIGVNDLHNWLESDNDRFRMAWDSVVRSNAQRGMLESGTFITDMIKFAQNFRRRRDGSIDSMMIQLQQLGINLDTLKIDRRLPFRIGQAIKPYIERANVDDGVYPPVATLDLL